MNKLLTFWGNLVQNYDGNIKDSSFLEILCLSVEHDKAIELIDLAFSDNEIERLKNVPMHRNRLDFSDTLDDIFYALWNNERANKKCRIILENLKDYLLAIEPPKKLEPIEKRFNDIKHIMRLSDLESEILILAYVKSQMCFECT